MQTTPEQVEQFLLEQDGWVTTKTICNMFDIPERALRACKGNPGFCTDIAISCPGKGYKHYTRATDKEFNEYYARVRSHGISELVSVRNMRRKRQGRLTKTEPISEVESRQRYFPGMAECT